MGEGGAMSMALATRCDVVNWEDGNGSLHATLAGLRFWHLPENGLGRLDHW